MSMAGLSDHEVTDATEPACLSPLTGAGQLPTQSDLVAHH
jgi:hypothetical protein